MDSGRELLAWYERNRRDLPWRRRRDPYAVWISEIMLQQTRVEAARGYFERFLERFPSVERLAAATTDEVLAAWSGLGYYRRARQLHAAAQEVVARGAFPERAAELEELAGIGPYTAAAIASIAFGEAVPVLDGNVARVLARVVAEERRVGEAAVRRRLLAAAAGLLVPGRPGDSNQAMMELGATVCLPLRPRCPDCPLATVCAAFGAGRPEHYPVRAARRPPTAVRQLAALVVDGERLLLVRRGEDEGQLAGLWELPLVEAASAAAGRRGLAERYGGEWTLGPVAGRVRHAITSRALTIEVRRAERQTAPGEVREGLAGADGGWFPLAEARRLALTGVARKIVEKFAAEALRERDG
ncbi:MAG: A/G-specific adenine glycosylase [Thermoanaerobaculia bacterium]